MSTLERILSAILFFALGIAAGYENGKKASDRWWQKETHQLRCSQSFYTGKLHEDCYVSGKGVVKEHYFTERVIADQQEKDSPLQHKKERKHGK